jgi:general secretion pathway protein L
MMFLRRIADGFSRWIDGVAAVIIALHGWFGSSRLVRLVEQPDGTISAQAARRAKEPQGEPMQIRDGRIVEPIPAHMAATLKGSQVELILQPNRFVFRALELPRRAADFLDGVVRAQIDRLTPWSAADAAFGWSLPTEIADGRVLVIVAATAHSRIAPLVQALMGQGADGVVVSAIPQGAETASTPIRVYERKTRGSLEFQRLRRVLMSILALTGLLASGAVAAAVVYGNELQDRRYDVARRIAERRAALEIGRSAVDESGLAVVEKRKREVPSSVIVLEAMSQILPDHTYLTELRVQGDKLQIVGITRDAPSLIRLIEQSSHFSQATFFAPTTRSLSEAGEHFNIEARIEPVYTPGP